MNYVWLWAVKGNADSSGLLKKADLSDIADVFALKIEKGRDPLKIAKLKPQSRLSLERWWITLDGQMTAQARRELQRYVDDRTPFFMRSGARSQLATGCSSVERLVIMRDQMERLRKSHLNKLR